MCQTGSLFTCAVFTRNLESPCSTTKGGRVNVWVSCVCFCVCTTCTIRSNTWAQQPILQLYLQLCLEPGLLLSPGSPRRAARSSEKEPEREREQPWPPALAAETMATRLTVTAGDRNRHKHRNRPFCHWDRPAEAWESGGGTVSGSLRLSRLFLICPNMTKKWCTCWLYAVISQWSLRETLRAPQSRRE